MNLFLLVIVEQNRTNTPSECWEIRGFLIHIQNECWERRGFFIHTLKNTQVNVFMNNNLMYYYVYILTKSLTLIFNYSIPLPFNLNF